MSSKTDILTFRATAKGFFYDGYEMFENQIIEDYRDFWTQRCLSINRGDLENFEGPILPMTFHILLDDNTGVLADVFIESSEHKAAVVNTVRGFLQNADFTAVASSPAKPVAIIVCFESAMWDFPTEGLSDEEVQEKIRNRHITAPKFTALNFIVSHVPGTVPEEEREKCFAYKATTSGLTEKLEGIQMAIAEVWKDLFTVPPTLKSGEHLDYYSPAKAVVLVSETIKKIKGRLENLKKTETISAEEKSELLKTINDHIAEFEKSKQPGEDKKEQQ